MFRANNKYIRIIFYIALFIKKFYMTCKGNKKVKTEIMAHAISYHTYKFFTRYKFFLSSFLKRSISMLQCGTEAKLTSLTMVPG